MELNPIFFTLFASLAIAFALMVVLKKNPVASAFSLVLVFFCFAAMYAMLDAHLLAALQILVYAGAIMVLFIFVIMLLAADVPSFDLGRSHMGLRVGSGILSLVMLGLFIWVFRNTQTFGLQGILSQQKIQSVGGNTQAISQLMFSDYLLPFELTSVLLLAGIVGAVAIAKRQNPRKEGR
jgi:NADH-quinone oxidoreductase subunit J